MVHSTIMAFRSLHEFPPSGWLNREQDRWTMNHEPAQCNSSNLQSSEAPSVGRRAFLAATAVATFATRSFGHANNFQEPPVRYPDPRIVVLDKRFAKYRIGNTPVQ